MYFAFENLTDTTLAGLIKDVSAQLASQTTTLFHTYALVDCAFEERLLSNMGLRKLPRASLYERTRLSAFGAASPFLLRLPDEGRARAESIALLATLSGRRPMWSLIVTHINLEELASHFTSFLLGRCSDGLAWPVRWADVRVIQPLLDTISEHYRRDLLRPFRAWLFPTRRGTVQMIAGESAPYRILNYTHMEILDRQFAQLLDQSEPDAVITQISDTQAGLLVGRRPSVSHEIVANQLKKASQIGLLASPLRLHFSTFALILNPNFETHPEFLTLLENIAKGATYHDEIEKLSADFWQETSVSTT
jgi:hypothetical protein